MKPEIKKKWLDALRSGQYLQCERRLTDGERFCCLGVLTNLYALETGQMWEREGTDIVFEKAATALPREVLVWAGLTSSNPDSGLECHAGGKYRGRSLAEWNDSGIADFQKIAELIEEHL